MSWLFNLIYCGLILLASPWLLYQAVRYGKYRAGYGQKLLGRVPRREGDRFCVWLHAVSVGEVNLLGTVIQEIERQRPDWECVISTTTSTGYELAQKKFAGRLVCYCPLDFSWAVDQAFRRLRPDMLVLAELEVWPNLVRAARRWQVAVAVVNGRLSAKSFQGYLRFQRVLRPIFQKLDLVAAQNEEYAKRFQWLGAGLEAVCTTGSIKYDGAESDRGNARTQALMQRAGFDNDDQVLLAGSTQAPEEQVALSVFRRLRGEFPRLRLVLVPRHAERFNEVADLLDKSGLAWQRRSELETAPPTADARILLVDTIGELGAWWGSAQIAFVGGSLGNRGGQNMIEPAAYGAAVCFGPNTCNFRDIVSALLAADAARVVAGEEELYRFVRRCLNDPQWAAALGHRAAELVAAGQGATTRTVTRLIELVEGIPEVAAVHSRAA